MTIWSELKLPKIAWPSPFNVKEYQQATKRSLSVEKQKDFSF